MPPSSTGPTVQRGGVTWHGREHQNKKASYTYFLTDEFTAGLVVSVEIKSIRAGKASITEGYCRFDVVNCGCTTCMWRNTPTPDTCPDSNKEPSLKAGKESKRCRHLFHVALHFAKWYAKLKSMAKGKKRK